MGGRWSKRSKLTETSNRAAGRKARRSWFSGGRALRNALLYTRYGCAYTAGVIRSFRHKGLAELFESGVSAKVRRDLHTRALRRLDALDQAVTLADLRVPGFDFHGLRGSPQRYSLHVNGPWCITFEWRAGDAWRVDLEQYH